MSDEQTVTQEYLPSGGSIAGIPGSYGPGLYEVDWVARTARRVVDGVAVADTHIVFLPDDGTIEGLPGTYKAGTYQVDWTTHTATQLRPTVEEKSAAQPSEAAAPDVPAEVAHLEAEIQTLEAEQPTAPPAGTEA